jgi:uncharacterized protein YrrD
MKNSQLKGLGVISVAEGKKLGTVGRVYFDSERRSVAGFVVHEGGGLLSTEPDRSRVLDASEVHSLGPDALMVANESVMRGEEMTARYADLVDLDDLLTRKAVTEGGTRVGDVAAVDVDEQTFALRAVEVSPGFFQTNREIPANQVVSVGHDVVVMSDEVCAPEPGAESPTADAGRHFVVVDERDKA